MYKPTSLTRWTATALIALAAGLGATAAQAGGVQWNVGINVPLPGVVVYPQQPVVVAPQPVYVPPQPVYVQPRPVYVQPQPVYVQPQPVYMAEGRWHHHHHHYREGWRDDDGYRERAPRGYGW